MGSHPHPNPLPSRERGTAWRRGWVPVCTGTTGVCGMGESPSPPVSSTGQALRQAQGRLRPLPSRERGTAWRRGWVPVCTGTTVGMGSPASPQPSAVEGEGDGVPPGMGSRLHGNDGWHGESSLTPTLLPSRERGFRTQPRPLDSRPRLRGGMPKPESTEGGRCVSVLEWQGGAPALLG